MVALDIELVVASFFGDPNVGATSVEHVDREVALHEVFVDHPAPEDVVHLVLRSERRVVLPVTERVEEVVEVPTCRGAVELQPAAELRVTEKAQGREEVPAPGRLDPSGFEVLLPLWVSRVVPRLCQLDLAADVADDELPREAEVVFGDSRHVIPYLTGSDRRKAPGHFMVRSSPAQPMRPAAMRTELLVPAALVGPHARPRVQRAVEVRMEPQL
jgi:hypothetical protein